MHNQLSDREFEVMRFLASEKTVSEIAETMHLGVTTVSTDRSRILAKLQLKNNAELMRYAVQQGSYSHRPDISPRLSPYIRIGFCE